MNGVHVIERLKVDEALAQRVSGFALTMQPLKYYGAVRSTVAPSAIR